MSSGRGVSVCLLGVGEWGGVQAGGEEEVWRQSDGGNLHRCKLLVSRTISALSKRACADLYFYLIDVFGSAPNVLPST